MTLSALLKKLRPDWLTLVLLGLIVYLWFRPPAWVSEQRESAPTAPVTLLTGRAVSLPMLSGKVVLVNFWATWCPYCRHEMPAMEAYYRAHRDEGFEILAVSTDADVAEVRAFLAREGYTFPVAMATAEFSRGFGSPSRLPTSFLVDRHGVVRHKISGQVHTARLEALAGPLLREPGGAATSEGSPAAGAAR